MEQCFWNPYAKGANYAAVWAEAKAFEGKRVRIIDKNGWEEVGVCQLCTVVFPGPGVGVTVVNRGLARYIGGVFQAIELEPGA